jgi:hypothetical protein
MKQEFYAQSIHRQKHYGFIEKGQTTRIPQATSLFVTELSPPQWEAKAVPLHATEALGGRKDIAPTHFWARH